MDEVFLVLSAEGNIAHGRTDDFAQYYGEKGVYGRIPETKQAIEVHQPPRQL
jgi:hypothetical protein